jgi:hypothetical protein
MSNLLAVCHTQQCKAKAQQLFRQVCKLMQRIKGVKLNDQAEADGFLVARFASALSPAPNVMQLREKGLILAVAGWCQMAKERRIGKPALGMLADEYLNHNNKDIFSCLQGQCAAVCVESRQRRMLGWVDRLWLMPGYIYSVKGIAWFSTSSMALASVVKPPLDLHSVRTLFLDRCPTSPHSLFEGISRLGFG